MYFVFSRPHKDCSRGSRVPSLETRSTIQLNINESISPKTPRQPNMSHQMKNSSFSAGSLMNVSANYMEQDCYTVQLLTRCFLINTPVKLGCQLNGDCKKHALLFSFFK
ncbi:hypothetical protein XELAEV_18044706mg [Xenopus laevis]|uniref:Uncharacterized protein n=1 Tax=Xenopus laevis TaxID=8355 RepID=A0A974BZA6_XENLA|nr:hypothetical protein XELAEV_18044706mg [Xenopus laevis]